MDTDPKSPKLTVLNAPKSEQPCDELKLIQQVGEWAEKNFRGKHGSDWGMLEEVGEAAHCILKNRQGIRGFDDEAFFMSKLTDAFADIIIYLAHWCHLHHAFFKFGRNQIQPDELATHERTIMIHILQNLSSMFSHEDITAEQNIAPAEVGVYNMMAQRMCNGIEYWAAKYNIDLVLAVAAVWSKKVGKRDWIANPKAPLPDQE